MNRFAGFTWTEVAVVLGIIGVLFLSVFGVIAQRKTDEENIRTWAAGQDYRVQSVEECLFTTGPFWLKDEGQHIYKAVLIDKLEQQRISYFRTGLFEFSQAWQE